MTELLSMQRAFSASSISEAVADWAREHGISVIEGGCSQMLEPSADSGHTAMRFALTLTGTVPRRVSRSPRP
jgi:uncharacterized protein